MNPIEKAYLKITETDTKVIRIKINMELKIPDFLIIKFKKFTIFFNISRY